jgi:hypothetical protein
MPHNNNLTLFHAAAVGAQQGAGQADACTPLPLPPNGKTSMSPNGVTNPQLLTTLVAEVDAARVFPDSKTIV